MIQEWLMMNPVLRIIQGTSMEDLQRAPPPERRKKRQKSYVIKLQKRCGFSIRSG
ncbi:hypothetical protein BDP27DRAFT_1289514 [Rhodocollybia butyracea]|uniref:Uncharacterized protein n=1 Tax=Rhodocollybia butyracea TaxID=206335 RepID=A0A9P5PV49_9AGAR|nr:hypothetical protein BDP27DRAFT_1289514 [Rhodocollybia butyracea]